MPGRRTFTALIGAVLAAFLVLTAFHAFSYGRSVRHILRDRELPSIGLAVQANLDRTSASLRTVGEELLRDNVIRDWILDGERDEEELRGFMEQVRARFDMHDASIVSDRTETYYSTDGRTLRLSPTNTERDGWYYAYRETQPSGNIDAWYYPETGILGIWLNLSILDENGRFLGIAGGGVDSTDFVSTMNVYGRLEGISVYLARPDGQLVYATDKSLLVQPVSSVDDVWGSGTLEALVPVLSTTDPVILEPSGRNGCILWGVFAEEWDTYLVVEMTGDVVASRVRGAVTASLIPSGFLTIALFLITLSTILLSRKRIEDQQTELQRLAGTDQVTGLYNRLRFDRFVKEELARIARTDEESSLIILDLDRFKHVNDTYGHPSGDVVLRTIAGVLQREVRSTDTVARFGGEEFTILLPGTSVAGAGILAEHIRCEIEACRFDAISRALRVTASFGVSALRAREGAEFHQAYSEADEALYEAKRSGRNRVCSAPGIKRPV